MKRSRRWPEAVVSAVGSIICAVAVTGCTPISASSANRDELFTPSESVTLLYDFYAKTVEHLHGVGWQQVPDDANVLGVVPQECTLSDGTSGVHYSDALGGPGEADAAMSAVSVAQFWTSLGLKAEAGKSTNPNDPQLVATGSDSKINARYTVDSKGSSISLVTACVPGDIDQLTERVIKHREHQSASPKPPAG